MNFGRLAAAAAAATVADMVYGFLVYAQLLGPSFSKFPGVFRPSDDMSHMGYLVVGVFIVMLCAAFIFARGYEGGTPVAEGLRFGGIVGTLMAGISVINYATLNIGRKLTVMMATAGWVEWLIMGIVIAVVVKRGAPVPVRRAAAV